MSSAAFLVHPTPIGQALIVVTDSGLTRLEILDRPADVALGELSLRTGVLPVPGAAQTANVAAQLDE